jgi:predicted dehydrogenase
VYDSGITVKNDSESIYKTMIGYRTGDMWSPKIDGAEALGELARHFLACIEKKEKPVTSGLMGMRIVKLLEAATKSMADRGRVVEL